MQTLSEWDHLDALSKDDADIAQPKTPEAVVDQLGFKISLLVICVALFLALYG